MFNKPAEAQRLHSKRDKLQVRIRKAYHINYRNVKRQAILQQQLLTAVEGFQEAYEASPESKDTHRALNELANLLLVSQLRAEDLVIINEALLYATLNELIGRCRSSALVELALQVQNEATKTQAVLTGYELYGAFLDDVADLCQPILRIFGELSNDGKCDVLWCIANMLSHKEADQLLKLLSSKNFVNAINEFFEQIIIGDEWEEQTVDAITTFGANYLYACRTLTVGADQKLTEELAKMATCILQHALTHNNFSSELQSFVWELLEADYDLFEAEDQLFELLLSTADEPARAAILEKHVQKHEEDVTMVFQRLLQRIAESFQKPSVEALDCMLKLLNNLCDLSRIASKQSLMRSVDNKLDAEELVAMLQYCDALPSFQRFVLLLIEDNPNRKRYLPLLEELDRRSTRQQIDGCLLFVIDQELNGPTH